MLDVFFDTNVLYRAVITPPKAAQRDEIEQAEVAKQLWQAVKDKRIAGYLAVFSLTTIYSLAENEYKQKWRRQGADWHTAETRARRDAYDIILRGTELGMLSICNTLAEDIDMVKTLMSENLACNDFEDNLQLVCAYEEHLTLLVTFNTRDFICSPKLGIEVVTPKQLLLRL